MNINSIFKELKRKSKRLRENITNKRRDKLSQNKTKRFFNKFELLFLLSFLIFTYF